MGKRSRADWAKAEAESLLKTLLAMDWVSRREHFENLHACDMLYVRTMLSDADIIDGRGNARLSLTPPRPH